MTESLIHEEFMELALEQAREALKKNEVPVGGVVVNDGSVIMREHNRTNETSDPLAHAEFIALKNIIAEGIVPSDRLTFYITVEPCVMCNGVLERAGVRVFFGCRNEIFGTKKLTGKDAGTHLHDNRCIEILQDFYGRENLLAPEEKRLAKHKKMKEESS